MSETSHLKGPCQQCGGTIEFPADGAGLEVNCPHCDQPTVLAAAPAVEAPIEVPDDSSLDTPSSSSKRKPAVLAVLVLVVAAMAAGAFLLRGRPDRSRASQPSPAPPPTNVAAPKEAPIPPTNVPTPTKAPKSIDDFKVGRITLEKTRGSSLVYAIGVLRNDSEHQRFGVSLELELADAQGNQAGTAKDYRAVLEPRQEWRFRALVLEAKAVSARVAAIREEE
jgi:hypothetical protein